MCTVSFVCIDEIEQADAVVTEEVETLFRIPPASFALFRIEAF